jgi:hypothetical protein
MDPAGRDSSTSEIERRLLAALCAPSLDEETRAQLFDRLARHKFAGPDHEVIFQALLKMRATPARHIRETLGASLTRLGFPDIDVEPIFQIDPPSAQQIAALLDRLTH